VKKSYFFSTELLGHPRDLDGISATQYFSCRSIDELQQALIDNPDLFFSEACYLNEASILLLLQNEWFSKKLLELQLIDSLSSLIFQLSPIANAVQPSKELQEILLKLGDAMQARISPGPSDTYEETDQVLRSKRRLDRSLVHFRSWGSK
jgi:hypothetical protein